jgi:DNA-binding CsgD family transcriptional regulator
MARETGLTPRERQVLELSAQGYGRSYIAHHLGIGQDRVKTIQDQIKTKLNVPLGRTVEDMVVVARLAGLVRG